MSICVRAGEGGVCVGVWHYSICASDVGGVGRVSISGHYPH